MNGQTASHDCINRNLLDSCLAQHGGKPGDDIVTWKVGPAKHLGNGLFSGNGYWQALRVAALVENIVNLLRSALHDLFCKGIRNAMGYRFLFLCQRRQQRIDDIVHNGNHIWMNDSIN